MEKSSKNRIKKYVLLGCLGVFVLFCGLPFLTFGYFYYVSGWGRCKLGETLYFEEKEYEECYRIGTRVDPVPEDYRIFTVSKTPWTASSEFSDEQVFIYDLGNSDEYYEDVYKDTNAVKIIEHTSSEIEIEIYDLYIMSEGEGVDLDGCKDQKVTIERGETVKAGTCMMDYGVHYEFTYE